MVTLKKLSVLALCFCFASLVACGGGEEENNASTTPQMTTPQTMDMASNNNTSNTEDMGTSGDMNTSPNNTSTPEDMSDGVDMAMTTPTEDMAGGEDMAADMATPTDMGGGGDMMMAGEFATMSGVVTRSTEPRNGGVGDLYVAVFDDDPITGGGQLVASAIIEDVDMNPPGVSIAYEVTMIPLREEAYYYTAFLDDNNTVDQSDPNNAGPDKDDLIHFPNFSIPQRQFNTAMEYQIDLDLNLAVPF